MVASGDMISDTFAKSNEKSSGIEMVEVRSALTCQTRRGICKKCYGKSLSTNRMADSSWRVSWCCCCTVSW